MMRVYWRSNDWKSAHNGGVVFAGDVLDNSNEERLIRVNGRRNLLLQKEKLSLSQFSSVGVFESINLHMLF